MALSTTSNLSGTTGTSQAFSPWNATNWSDFGVIGKTADSVILSGLSSPLDAKNKIRYQYGRIANIYTGTDINTSLQLANREGVSLLVQSTSAVSVADSADAKYRALMPISAHMVLRFARDNNMTPALLAAAVKQLINCILANRPTGATTYDNFAVALPRLMRGGIDPTEWPVLT